MNKHKRYPPEIRERAVAEAASMENFVQSDRNQPLTAREQQGNRTRARVRVRVEHVFGAQCATRAKLVRCIGLKRSELAIGMMNLVYNMRRLCYLQGISAPA